MKRTFDRVMTELLDRKGIQSDIVVTPTEMILTASRDQDSVEFAFVTTPPAERWEAIADVIERALEQEAA